MQSKVSKNCEVNFIDNPDTMMTTTNNLKQDNLILKIIREKISANIIPAHSCKLRGVPDFPNFATIHARLD